jgi:hypothetical protein
MCSINRQIPLLIQRLGPPRPCRQPERGLGRGGFWDLGLERRGRAWGSSSLAAPGGITEGVLGSSPRAQTASPAPFPSAGSKTTPPGSRHRMAPTAGQHSSAGSAGKAATGGSDGARDVGGEDPVGGERGGGVEGSRAPSRAGSRGGSRAGTPRSAAQRGPVLLRLDELGVARGGAGGRVGQKRPLSELPGEAREDGEAGEGQQPGGETGQGGVGLAEAPAAQEAAPRQTTSWLRRIFSRPA